MRFLGLFLSFFVFIAPTCGEDLISRFPLKEWNNFYEKSYPEALRFFEYPDLLRDGWFAETFYERMKTLRRKNDFYDSIYENFCHILNENPSPRNEAVRRKVLDQLLDWHREKPRSPRPFRCLQGFPMSDIFLEKTDGAQILMFSGCGLPYVGRRCVPFPGMNPGATKRKRLRRLRWARTLSLRRME